MRLEAHDIYYRYGRSNTWLLHGVSMSLQSGEIVGLTAPSGRGKSTLCRILAGYETPHKGLIRLSEEQCPHQCQDQDQNQDQDFHSSSSNIINIIKKTKIRPPRETMVHPVQLIWQHPEQAINPRWRMRQVLSEAEELDSAVLTALGIAPQWLERYPNELSGGELQRFCIARALGPHTRFLIADEITTMLDAITQAQIWHDLVKIARDRNIGVLVVSHDRRLIDRLCQRVIEL